MIRRRLVLWVVAIVAFPLMFIGLLGMALWLAVNGDCSPVTIRKEPA